MSFTYLFFLNGMTVSLQSDRSGCGAMETRLGQETRNRHGGQCKRDRYQRGMCMTSTAYFHSHYNQLFLKQRSSDNCFLL